MSNLHPSTQAMLAVPGAAKAFLDDPDGFKRVQVLDAEFRAADAARTQARAA